MPALARQWALARKMILKRFPALVSTDWVVIPNPAMSACHQSPGSEPMGAPSITSTLKVSSSVTVRIIFRHCPTKV